MRVANHKHSVSPYNLNPLFTTASAPKRAALRSVYYPELVEDNGKAVKIEISDVGLNTLSPTGVARRLANLVSYTATELPSTPVSISRLLMSKNFGGSSQGLCPSIDRQRHAHDYEFAFPGLETNPHAPYNPGEPGLLYRTTDDVPWGERTVKLLVRFNRNDYRYLGDYQTIRTTPLSQDEYRNLSFMVGRLVNDIPDEILKISSRPNVHGPLSFSSVRWMRVIELVSFSTSD